MKELYSELLVARKTTAKDRIAKVGLIMLTTLSFAAGIVFFPVFLLVGVFFLVVDYFFLPTFDVEYEYLYVNGSIDVDRIYAKSRRKRAVSVDLNNMEIMAPSNSHRLDSYRQGNIKVEDFSSQTEGNRGYIFILSDNGKRRAVKLELDENMLEDIKQRFPRKVFMD